ncbi:MAG: PD40 domain-containing protein [Anaerolineaceae bacterium]|nr:PD40 domain-containing protein [Anaerolineaceae bacterium]
MKLFRFIPIIFLILGIICSGCSPGNIEPEVLPEENLEKEITTEAEEVPTDTQAPPPTEIPTIEPTETPEPETEVYDGPSRIVFSSNRDDPNILGLYLINPTTGEISSVETGMEFAIGADWSPDGNRIAFTVSTPWAIYIINSDGSDLTQLTDYSSAMPSWSPDSQYIVHQSDHQNEPQDTPDIYIVNADGTQMREILDEPDVPDFRADWSPDGQKILFVSNRDGSALYTMNTDGSEVTILSDHPDPIVEGTWSPDGTKIAFIAGKFGDNMLYVMDANGENVVLVNGDGPCNEPSWSPDGKKIVFVSNRSGNFDLWLVNVDGTELVQLTNDEFYVASPDWSIGTME